MARAKRHFIPGYIWHIKLTGAISGNFLAFTEKMKSLLGFKARGRDVVKGDGMYHLREEVVPYKALFEGEKFDIDPKNTYFWEIKTE